MSIEIEQVCFESTALTRIIITQMLFEYAKVQGLGFLYVYKNETKKKSQL